MLQIVNTFMKRSSKLEEQAGLKCAASAEMLLTICRNIGEAADASGPPLPAPHGVAVFQGVWLLLYVIPCNYQLLFHV